MKEINAATLQFIATHADADVRELALQGSHTPDVDLRAALVQIEGRQRARLKLPTWTATAGIRWPERLPLEQCSSEATALYKREIAERRIGRGKAMADLTGGLGVDFAALSPLFDKAFYIEQNSDLCDLAANNLPLMGATNAEITCAQSTDIIDRLPDLHLIYIDPARRDNAGRRTYALEDCTPNVVPLMGRLLEKAPAVMLKLSPMVSIHSLPLPAIAELHIVATQNEVKEIVALCLRDHNEPPTIYCKNDRQTTVFADETTDFAPQPALPASSPAVGQWLYEPNAAIMKSGCFRQLAARYPQAAPIAANSHLYTAQEPIGDFPGRHFQICAISSMKKSELKTALKGIDRANIATRNFPLSVADLRRRLKLKEGGDTYLFATTCNDGRHLLMVCRKSE